MSYGMFIECRCRKTAKRRAPWASVIVKVEGGFLAFDCYAEFQDWKRER